MNPARRNDPHHAGKLFRLAKERRNDGADLQRHFEDLFHRKINNFDDLTYAIGTRPTLSIAKTAPAEVLLQWPTNYTGFMVESSLSLDAPSLWQPMTNAVTVNGDVFSVPVSTTNAARFFRLHKPCSGPVGEF